MALAADCLDVRAQRHPESATDLGDHRFDARLDDISAAALDDERRVPGGYAARRWPATSRRCAGAFVEGWAVYAEELTARHGYPGDAIRARSACSS
ncbi:MAG TPA: hypothetical protein VFX25_20835 [Streptosporangiaceae bacterium]|nr:hypothetical protein [Streptosporangiaceae bacterium]